MASAAAKGDEAPVLHNDLIPEYPCDGELVPEREWSTPRLRVLQCVGCGTEIRYMPNCDWVTVILPGMKSDLGV